MATFQKACINQTIERMKHPEKQTKMQYTKEDAVAVQDILTMCLADAIDEALAAQIGEDWFKEFREEDKRDAHPMIRDWQRDIHECDFQALLKLLYFRTGYAQKVLEYYGKPEYINASRPVTGFQKTLDRLIKDYRNAIAAHVSVENLRTDAEGDRLEGRYGYPQAVEDMLTVAQVFRDVKNKENISYYDQIRSRAETETETGTEAGAKKEKKTKKSVIFIVIGAAVVAAAIVILFSTGVLTRSAVKEPSTGTVVSQEIKMPEETAIESETEAYQVAKEFLDQFREIAAAGIPEEAYSKYFTDDYTPEQIRTILEICGSQDYDTQNVRVFTYTKDAIMVFQKICGNFFNVILQHCRDGWKFSAATEELTGKYKDRLEELYGHDYPAGYYSRDFDVLFQEVNDSLELKIATARYTESGDLDILVEIHNGQEEDLNGLKLKNVRIYCITEDGREQMLADLSGIVIQCRDRVNARSIMSQQLLIDAQNVTQTDLSKIQNMEIEYIIEKD